METAADAVASAVDAVAEEDRTTLAPGRQLRVVSVQHSEATCSIMDTEQLQTRCEPRGKSLYNTWVQTTDKT